MLSAEDSMETSSEKTETLRTNPIWPIDNLFQLYYARDPSPPERRACISHRHPHPPRPPRPASSSLSFLSVVTMMEDNCQRQTRFHTGSATRMPRAPFVSTEASRYGRERGQARPGRFPRFTGKAGWSLCTINGRTLCTRFLPGRAAKE